MGTFLSNLSQITHTKRLMNREPIGLFTGVRGREILRSSPVGGPRRWHHALTTKRLPASPEREEGGTMSEERPQHPQEPAEGAEDAEEVPGVERATDNEGMPHSDHEERSADHPQEPAEGAEEAEEAPGAERAEGGR